MCLVQILLVFQRLIKVCFASFARAGKYELQLIVMSDSYVGCDKVVPIKFKVSTLSKAAMEAREQKANKPVQWGDSDEEDEEGKGEGKEDEEEDEDEGDDYDSDETGELESGSDGESEAGDDEKEHKKKK